MVLFMLFMEWFCPEQQLYTLEFFLATLVIKEKLTDDLLTISVTFIWFYKIENIVM